MQRGNGQWATGNGVTSKWPRGQQPKEQRKDKARGLDKGGASRKISLQKLLSCRVRGRGLLLQLLSGRNLRKSLEAVGQILSEWANLSGLRFSFGLWSLTRTWTSTWTWVPAHLSSRNFNFNLIDGQPEGQTSPWAPGGFTRFPGFGPWIGIYFRLWPFCCKLNHSSDTVHAQLIR